MKDSKEILSSVLKTTQMGQVGIRSVMNVPMRAALRRALESQLREYDMIEDEANALASQRGWEVEELDPALKGMSTVMSKARLSYGATDSKIAAMMIRGNTRGLIKGYKNLHQYNGRDSQISALTQKLLDYESANVRQMQTFL